MIKSTLEKIESRIQDASSINDAQKKELLELLATLETEVLALAKTHGEQADSIARFAEASTHEATRVPHNPQLFKLSVEGLNASVAEVEKSHPKLTQVANAICSALSNSGV